MKKLNKYNTVKKQAMSIAYAIILLIVVGVAIAGLTPVLTRKLPNLATSSTIKHPKGWYESYNAPKEGVKYCKTCKDHEPSPWPDPVSYNDETVASESDPCYGNPACLPYIDPKTPPAKIVAFERYCKGNGRCLPPVPCKDGKCQFTPPDGVTKFEVYAIGGGGGSGSAVASNNKGYGWPSGYKKIVGGRNDYDGVPANFYTTSYLPMGASTSKDQLGYSDRIVAAHFIDMNRYDTKIDQNTKKGPYTPADFVNDPSSQNLYPNKLKSNITNPKCATGILYTVGDDSRRNHILPTEDADSRLAAQSSKQVKRILKELGGFLNENKTYKLGSRNLNYYDRYYLFTKELGVYSYNQNPVYTLMPEWVKVTNDVQKYTGYREDPVFGEYSSNFCTKYNCDAPNQQNAKDECFKRDKNNHITKTKDFNICYINYYITGSCAHNDDNTGLKTLYPITTTYKTAAAVACSGNGQKGADVDVNDYTGSCPWMKPKVCRMDKVEQKRLGSSFDSNFSDTWYNCPPSTTKPPENNADVKSKYYCHNSTSTSYSKNNRRGAYYCGKSYRPIYYDRVCHFEKVKTDYMECDCDMKIELPPSCNRDRDLLVNQKCQPFPYKEPVDPNKKADLQNQALAVADAMNSDTAQGTMSNYEVTGTDAEGNEVKIGYVYNSEDGSLYAADGEGRPTGFPIMDIIGIRKSLGKSADDPVTDEEVAGMVEAMIEDSMEKTPDLEDAHADYIERKGVKNTSTCRRLNVAYNRKAYGIHGGKGICTYVIASINKGVNSITVTPPYKTGTSTLIARGYSANYSSDGLKEGDPQATTIKTMNTQETAANASYAQACINNRCAKATGATGGESGVVYSPACETNNAQNGDDPGSDGTKEGKGGKFDKPSTPDTSPLKYSSSAYYGIPNDSDDTYNGAGVTDGADIPGTQKRPGIYNFRYVWYMPFVTKHLLFGTSGDTGEELLTTVTLSKGQTLVVSPGKGAALTDYQSGNNGANGGDSTVKNEAARVNLAARGGKGGIGSQKTDEYVLCHISDLQTMSPDLPCYAKTETIKGIKTLVSGKKTHYYDKDERKYKGIQAIMPKTATIGKSLKMSESLKQSNPGAGAMGFGTESVSDFVCEERYVDKYDQIKGSPTKTATVIKSGGSLENNCKGNSRIRYILPLAKDYTSSTGAVIIVW